MCVMCEWLRGVEVCKKNADFVVQTGAGSLSYMVVLVVVGPGSGEGKSSRPYFWGGRGRRAGVWLQEDKGNRKGQWIVDRSSQTPNYGGDDDDGGL